MYIYNSVLIEGVKVTKSTKRLFLALIPLKLVIAATTATLMATIPVKAQWF
jgi:hypothetical protein